MDTTLIRAFVIMLALTGFGASTVKATPNATGGGGITNTPVPVCLPSDPSHCGID